jgi:hypothetical protein
MIKQRLFIISLAFLTACNSNYGDVVVRDKVQVFYLEPISKKQAEKLADYWMEKELIGTKMQYLQLSKASDVIQIKIIANDTNYLEAIPFEIQLELFKLDSMLRQDVFKNSEIQLMISDKTFTKSRKL